MPGGNIKTVQPSTDKARIRTKPGIGSLKGADDRFFIYVGHVSYPFGHGNNFSGRQICITF
ncbi:MAG: hypothetical protein AVO34_09215 [Firmicutes bacterium ML8_F2]|nr:MAG: hypothetical protein AVO34_09215 [Firmicutes bacterium ML8_F2]